MSPTENPANEKSPGSRPPYEQVALHAELLWRARGCPDGKDEEIWFEAERHLVTEPDEIDLGSLPLNIEVPTPHKPSRSTR